MVSLEYPVSLYLICKMVYYPETFCCILVTQIIEFESMFASLLDKAHIPVIEWLNGQSEAM